MAGLFPGGVGCADAGLPVPVAGRVQDIAGGPLVMRAVAVGGA